MSLANLLEPNLYDIYADNMSTKNLDTITINNSPYPPTGLLPTPVANKVLRTNGGAVVSWGDVNPSNLTGGSVGDVLKTVAPSTVAWDTIKPGDLAPGTARQLLETNSGATAAQWTSNIDIPGTLDCTGNAVFDGDLTVTNDLNVVNGDLTVANGGVSVLVDGISVEGNSAFNNDLNIDGEITLNSVSGAANQTIVSDGAGNQIWSSIPAAGINHGTAAQILVTNNLGTATQWSSDIITNDLACGGDLSFNSGSGTTGDLIVKTGATTQQWAKANVNSLNGSVSNRILTSVGTTPTWSDNIQVNGTLGSTGVATLSNNLIMTGNTAIFQMSGTTPVALFQELRVYDAFKCGATAGTDGQMLVSNGSSVLSWTFPQYFVEYYQNTLVDMNGSANVTLLAAAGVKVSNAKITYSAGTFTLTEAGDYEIRFTTIASTCAAKTLVFFKIDGTKFIGSQPNIYLPAITESQPLTLIRNAKLLAGTTLQVISQPIIAGTINTSAADANGQPTTLLTITRLGSYN